jgi:hypothetical protein
MLVLIIGGVILIAAIIAIIAAYADMSANAVHIFDDEDF